MCSASTQLQKKSNTSFRRILSFLMRKLILSVLLIVEKNSYGRCFLKCHSPCHRGLSSLNLLLFLNQFTQAICWSKLEQRRVIQSRAPFPKKHLLKSEYIDVTVRWWLRPRFWARQVLRYFSFSTCTSCKSCPLAIYFLFVLHVITSHGDVSDFMSKGNLAVGALFHSSPHTVQKLDSAVLNWKGDRGRNEKNFSKLLLSVLITFSCIFFLLVLPLVQYEVGFFLKLFYILFAPLSVTCSVSQPNQVLSCLCCVRNFGMTCMCCKQRHISTGIHLDLCGAVTCVVFGT